MRNHDFGWENTKLHLFLSFMGHGSRTEGKAGIKKSYEVAHEKVHWGLFFFLLFLDEMVFLRWLER